MNTVFYPRAVVKKNKRLWVTGHRGELDYTPPDFVRVRSRWDLWLLAADMEKLGRIEAIMQFERRFSTRDSA